MKKIILLCTMIAFMSTLSSLEYFDQRIQRKGDNNEQLRQAIAVRGLYHVSKVAKEKCLTIIKELIAAKTDLNCYDSVSRTPLIDTLLQDMILK